MKPRTLTTIVTIATLFVLSFWGGSWYLLVGEKERGTFGDMFGAVNALFSGLAFVGLILAILLQSEELKLQRRELESTRTELRGQKEQLELQNTTLRKQNFEETFFQLVRFQGAITQSLTIPGTPGFAGRACFPHMYRQFRHGYNSNQTRDHRLKINYVYREFFNRYQSLVGHYFRNLYQILKFVSSSDIENKLFYTNLLRAQLSSDEQALLFYNCLSELGEERFKPLIERFAFLESLDRSLLLNSEDVNLYLPSAFDEKLLNHTASNSLVI